MQGVPINIEQTARIPFDDRRSLVAKVEDISPMLVRRFLKARQILDMMPSSVASEDRRETEMLRKRLDNK